VTWSAPEDIALGGSEPLPPFGSDRINDFPALAVSPSDGSLHIVYASLQTADFGDVYYARSTDQGLNWSVPVTLNSAPGLDRAQFFPWISAGADGGLDAIWYDQRAGIEGSDLTDVLATHSEDGGLTWSAELTGLDSGSVELGDGVVMNFTPGVFAANDIFTVRASTPGYFDGDGEQAATDIGEGSPFVYGITGEEVFTDRGAVGVDIFEVMKNLKTALDANDRDGIRAQIDKLKDANDQVTFSVTAAGVRMNRMEVARSYQQDYDQRAADMLSKIEDADIAKLVTDMATNQLALQASYKATTIMTQDTTILDFLK